MIKTNVTIYRCDGCGKELTIESNMDYPEGWYKPSYANKYDFTFERLDNGPSLTISAERIILCSAECIGKFFSHHAQLAEAFMKEDQPEDTQP